MERERGGMGGGGVGGMVKKGAWSASGLLVR